MDINNLDFSERYLLGLSEKEAIKKSSNACAGTLICVLCIMAFWSYPVAFVMNLFGNASYLAEFARDDGGAAIIQIIISALSFTLPCMVLCKATKCKLFGIIDFTAPKCEDLIPLSIIGLGFSLFSSIATDYAGYIFELFGFRDPTTGSGSSLPKGFFGNVLYIISVAVIPPLVEEFALRGVVMGYLRRYEDSFAIFTSAILFGIMHSNISQIPFAFLVGVIIGYAVVVTKSIWTGVVIHMLNNSVSVLIEYFRAGLSYRASAYLSNTLVGVIIIVSIIVAALYYSDKSKQVKLGRVWMLSSFKQKMIWFLTSPAMIIFIIFSVIITFFLR